MEKDIIIFDFDATLIDTYGREEGVEKWLEKTGEKYPHKGWWGRKESLSLEVFDIQPNETVYGDYKIHKENGDTIYLVTGRLEKLRTEVEAILNKHELTFDGIFLRNGGKDTADFKLKLFQKMVDVENPASFTIYEDRFDHVKIFEEWARNLNIPFKIVFV